MRHKIDAECQMQVLGVFVHGALTFGHVLGLLFNFKRRNWFDVTMHGAAALYDVYAADKHLNRVLEIKHGPAA